MLAPWFLQSDLSRLSSRRLKEDSHKHREKSRFVKITPLGLLLISWHVSLVHFNHDQSF